jgi:signal transduction histidine kinase
MAAERRHQPFARRIVAAFTLMTFVVSGILSLCIVLAVDFVEELLVSRTLDKTLTRILDEDLPQGGAPRLDSDMWFFASDRPEYAIPEKFAEARTGFDQVEKGDEAYWVYVREVDGQRYMLVEDQHEFEAREKNLLGILFAGLLLTVVGAWALGRLTSKRIMAPVIRLAEQVRRLPQIPPVAPLARDYADDEIGHLAGAFDDALARLNLAMARERLFTSDVSHELRTPLMVIATSCELLAATGGLSGRGREQIERIARAAEEMRNLVETFLTLARGRPDAAASGRIAAENGLTLAAAAQEQRLHWVPGIEAKGLSFELSGEGCDAGRYDPACLRTVMGNLLKNALYYTERGGIRLVLEEGGFRVEDSGVGILAEERERVFQPFVRGAQARGEGLGLGLSLIKRICVHQGWRIALDAPPEGGSCFRVKFR